MRQGQRQYSTACDLDELRSRRWNSGISARIDHKIQDLNPLLERPGREVVNRSKTLGKHKENHDYETMKI